MDITLKKCRHLWLTDIQQGNILGHIGGAVLDKKRNHLMGFKIKLKTGPGHETEKWLPVENIKKIGKDMVLVANATKMLPQVQPGLAWERVQNMPVSSQDGRSLGRLQDLVIDDKTWAIKSLELEGQKKVVIDPEKTVLGDDLILVQAQAEVKTKAAPAVKVVPSRSSRRLTQKGEKLVKQTTRTLRKVLKGTEANLAKVRERLAQTNPNNIADLSGKRKTGNKVTKPKS